MYKKRLIATVVSIFAVGVVFGINVVEYDTFSLRAVFVALAAISVLFIVATKYFDNLNHKRIMAVSIAVTAFSFGVLRVSMFNNIGVDMSLFNKQNDNAEFEIAEIDPDHIEAYVISSEIGVPNGEKVRVYLDETFDTLVVGDRFCANVQYRYKDTAAFKSNGIALTASGSIYNIFSGNGFLYSIRKSVSENSVLLYDGFKYAPSISKAVSVGDCSAIDSHLYSLYKSSGISHILAISGLHVSLFSFTLYTLLLTVRVKRNVACVCASAVAIAYVALVGFTPGAVRAVTMFVFTMIMRIYSRRSDGITTLFMSLALLMLINPYSLCSVGLQLSYLCSLGIILSEPLLERVQAFSGVKMLEQVGIKKYLYKRIPTFIAPLVISFATAVFSFPVICTSFDTVSYISPFINIIAVPLFTYGIGFAIVAFIVAPLCLPLAKLIAYPSGLLFDFVTSITEKVYKAEIGNMSVHTALIFIPITLSLAMILVLVFMSKHRTHAFVTTAVAFCLSLYICTAVNSALVSQKNYIEYADTSGEYIYYQSKDKNIYIDISGYSSVTESVYDGGCTSLDQYVVIGYDKYTLKRFERFSGSMLVKKVCLPEPKNDTENKIYLQIKEFSNKRNCDIIIYEACMTENLSDALVIEVYASEEVNNAKMVCFRYNDELLRFVGGEFEPNIYGDAVVLMSDYLGSDENIHATIAFAEEYVVDSNEFSEQYISGFKNKLIIDLKESEGRLNIYEP